MVPSPPWTDTSTGTLLITVYALREPSGHSEDDGGSPVRKAAMYVPSGFFTSILSAPGRVPSSGATDWAIQSCGSSKLTVFPGSENVFQAEAVAAACGVAEVEAPPAPAGVGPAAGLEVPEVSGCSEVSGCTVGSGCAVQPGGLPC
jgi:hypothetical protein